MFSTLTGNRSARLRAIPSNPKECPPSLTYSHSFSPVSAAFPSIKLEAMDLRLVTF